MPLDGLDVFIWALGLLGHLTLLCVLCIRKRAIRFPAFTALIADNVLRSVVLYFALRYGTRLTYFYTYWSLVTVDLMLQLCVVHEMAANVFQPVGSWARDARAGLLYLIGASVVIAFLLTLLGPASSSDWRQSFVDRGSFFSAVLMGELFIGMVVLAKRIGLPWRTHIANLSQGFGVYSIICILIEMMNSCFASSNPRLSLVMVHTRMVVYLVCVGYWIRTLWADERVENRMPELLQRELTVLNAHTAYYLGSLRGGRN